MCRIGIEGLLAMCVFMYPQPRYRTDLDTNIHVQKQRLLQNNVVFLGIHTYMMELFVKL